MNKLSSYQKLKQENQQLKQDISELVISPNSLKSVRIRMEATLRHDMILMNVFGSRNNKGQGIFSQVEKHRNMVSYFLGTKW